MELSKSPNAGIIGNSSSLTGTASRTATSIQMFNFQTEETQSSQWAAQQQADPVASNSWRHQGGVTGGENCKLVSTRSELITRPQSETSLRWEEVTPTVKMKNNEHFPHLVHASWSWPRQRRGSTGTPALPAQQTQVAQQQDCLANLNISHSPVRNRIVLLHLSPHWIDFLCPV